MARRISLKIVATTTSSIPSEKYVRRSWQEP